MRKNRTALLNGRRALLACSALATGLGFAAAAHAQNAAAAPDTSNTPAQSTATLPAAAQAAPANAGTAPDAGVGTSSQGLEDIVVTAQRREQRLQDVPIAITAITRQSLETNRITNVTDLSGLAPNVTARPAGGGSQNPSFTSRGITSYGVVPGSDKEFSTYLDGVYLGGSRSLFELPDIERIEVLRGPQGTLFGRNATSGAVSVVTRDPTGVLGLHQDFTIGNYDQFRSRTSLDLPAVGPFSAYVSYVHDERRGDIRNTGAGTLWDRTGPNTNVGALRSPRYLGDRNNDQVFAAIKFDVADGFTNTFKFDYGVNHYTAEGVAPISYRPAGTAATLTPALGALGALYAAYFDTIVAANNPTFVTDAKRPDAVNNSFVTPSKQKVYGFNLTSGLTLSDSLSVKNIASYRFNYVNSTSQLDGLGGLIVPQSAVLPFARFVAARTVPNFFTFPAAVQTAVVAQLAANPAVAAGAQVGSRFLLTDNNSQVRSTQYSDELQFNYTSSFLTLTLGGLYFHQDDRAGGPPGITNTPAFAFYPASGRVPLGGQSLSFNKSESIAAYTQAELHVTPTIDVVLGGRVTHDDKSGSYQYGGTYVPPTGAAVTDPSYYTNGTFTGITTLPFAYKKTKFTYSAGVNYKPTTDLLFYGKYSTGFVSGGSIAGIPFSPETVGAAEIGAKADLFDRKVRANVALFHAVYKHLQSSQGGTTLGRPEIGTAIVDLGTERAQGIEAELTVRPVSFITLGANGGYTDAKYRKITPLFLTAYGTGYEPTLLPKYTSNLYGQVQSEPFYGTARVIARLDADFRSRVRFLSGSVQEAIPEFQSLRYGPSRWILNTRAGVEDLGPSHLGIALWARNLTNNRDAQFPLALATYGLSTSFQQARTYGLDLTARF